MLHACVLCSLHRSADAAKKHGKKAPMELLRGVRSEFTRVARLRWREQRTARRGKDFDRAWSAVCDVRRGGGLRVHVLDDLPPVQRDVDAPIRTRVYTDGSMRAHVANARAGWAFVAVDISRSLANNNREESVLQAHYGPVNVTPGGGGYDGATRHSNNTGELTALLRAVRWVAAQPVGDRLELCVDSTYAIGIALGRFVPRARNAELARRVQQEYACLRASRPPGTVTIRHVRAHARSPGNETADRLAKLGAELGAAADATARARSIYADERAKAREDHQSSPSAPSTTSTSAPTPSSFNPPVVAHSLGVG